MKLPFFEYRTSYLFLLVGLSICLISTLAHGQHTHGNVKPLPDSTSIKSNLNSSNPKTSKA
ncbi:MAG TPA: hypothetical protein VF599_17205, partial [Pyrinomonadaceae bacterium]